MDETASKSHDKLLRHYKELNSKLYSGRISKEERDSLRKLQDKLDELDEQDPDLVATVARVEKGYDELTSGLTQINRIIDGLLSR